jgi:hypothetical protein
MRHLANFALGVGLDVLHGMIGTREAGAVLGSVRETRRTVQAGIQIGENRPVLDHPGQDGGDTLAREEAELTAKLEAVRERRGV